MNINPYIIPGIFAFFATIIGCIGALKLFPKLGLMDRPKKYGLNRKPIPYYGGLIIYFVLIISLFTFLPITKEVIGLIIGASLITGISFLDDLYDVSPWIRLTVQIISATIIVLSGIGIASITNPLGEPFLLNQIIWRPEIAGSTIEISLVSAMFTIFWIVLVTNTMNFLDGLNGLPSGVTAIAMFSLFLLSIRTNYHQIDQTQLATITIIVSMSCLAFWFFDFHPAKILMGDTGSMLIGFLLAVTAIFSGGKIATAFLVFGIPILDLCWVVFRRIFIDKKSPMIGDLKHLHHRLIGTGLSERKALSLIYIICATFGILAVFLESHSKLYLLIALTFLMAIIGFVVVKNAKKL